MQETIFRKSEFREAYEKFTSERHLSTTCVANLQEDTLMEIETYKYVERWCKKAYQAIEQIDDISVVQKGRDTKEHGI
jgi:hypothetical protein